MNNRHIGAAAALLVFGACLTIPAGAQSVASPYDDAYSIIFNATVADVAFDYGGAVFKAGDANTLYLMGAANGASGTLYSVPIFRGADNHITGFGNTSSVVATAAFNDAGLVYAPNGALIYTRYPNGELGQIKPGSSTTDKVVNLNTLAGNTISGSAGGLQFVPTGVAGAGTLKLSSIDSGDWYDVTLTDDGTGTYDVAVSKSLVNTNNGPEGFVYVQHGNVHFAADSILVSDYFGGRILAYTTDSDGTPVLNSQAAFLNGLTGAEGAAMDPLTGDLLFTAFGSGNNKVVVVKGITERAGTPEPGTLALVIGLASAGLTVGLKRRRKA